MGESDRVIRRQANAPEDLIGMAEGAAADLSGTLKGRELVRTTIRRMSDDDWALLRGRIGERFTHERKADELAVLDLVLRRGMRVGDVDAEHPDTTRGNAKGLLYYMLERIASDGPLMEDVRRIDADLGKIPPVTHDQAKWALHRMSANERATILDMLPDTAVEGERDRNRNIAGDIFERHMSVDEIQSKHGFKTVNGAKSAERNILMAVADEPLARKAILGFIEASEAKAMGEDEALRLMHALSPKDRSDVLERVPPYAWNVKVSDPAERQSQIERQKGMLLEFLEGDWNYYRFTREYNQRHPGKDIPPSNVKQTLTRVLARITDQPALVDMIRQKAQTQQPAPSEPAEVATEAAQPPPSHAVVREPTKAATEAPQPPPAHAAVPVQAHVLSPPVSAAAVVFASAEVFDAAVQVFGNRFSQNTGKMMKAAGLDGGSHELKKALAALYTGRRLDKLWGDIIMDRQHKGEAIPRLISYLRTQPPGTSSAALAHFGDHLLRSMDKPAGFLDMNRLALYAAVSSHLMDNPDALGGDAGLLRACATVSADYRGLPEGLNTSTTAAEYYRTVIPIYDNIANAVRPKA